MLYAMSSRIGWQVVAKGNVVKHGTSQENCTKSTADNINNNVLFVVMTKYVPADTVLKTKYSWGKCTCCTLKNNHCRYLLLAHMAMAVWILVYTC